MEAALLEVTSNAATGDAWLLLDCHGAFQVPRGNTAVVVVRDVSEPRWTNAPRGGWTWQAVMSWEPRPHPAGLALRVGLTPDAELHVVGSGGELYVGNVPGDNAPRPTSRERATRRSAAGLASWSGDIDVVADSYR